MPSRALPFSIRGVDLLSLLGGVFALLLTRRWCAWMNVAQFEGRAVESLLAGLLWIALWAWLGGRWGGHPLLLRWLRAQQRHPGLMTLSILLFSWGYFVTTALASGRDRSLLWMDERMEMVQIQLLSRGLLSAPQHPLADHMETFFVFVKPVYAALYFPGTALLFTPLHLLGLAPWLFSSLMAAALVATSYRLGVLWFSHSTGLAAALMVLSCDQLRFLSLRLVAHHVGALTCAWICLRFLLLGSNRPLAALWLGAAIGFAAITRPVEALAFTLPVALGLVAQLPRRGWRWLLRSAALTILGTLPFLLLQFNFNAQVSGSPWVPPYHHYTKLFHAGTGYATLGRSENARVDSQLPQKTDYYLYFIKPLRDYHAGLSPWRETLINRAPLTLIRLTPFPLMLVFLVVGLGRCRERHRWILLLIAPAFLILYAPHAYYLVHHAVGLMVPLALVAASGLESLRQRWQAPAGCFVGAFVGCCLWNWPGLNPWLHEGHQGGRFRNPSSQLLQQVLAQKVQRPAVVLVRYRGWNEPYQPQLDSFHDEPVFTLDALWPEEAPVAVLNALGPKRDLEVASFFLARGNRHLYLLDRRRLDLVDLGTCSEVLRNGFPEEYLRRFPSVSGGAR